MTIVNKIDIHLDAYEPTPEIVVMQCDANTRVLQFSLYYNKAKWQCPVDADLYVSFRKPDGKGGFYDTLPDGTKACSLIPDNVISATLAEQVLTVSGKTHVAVSIRLGDDTLATFAVQLRVMPNPGVGAMKSVDYFCLRAAIDAAEQAAARPSLRFTVLSREDGSMYIEERYTAEDLIAAHEAGKVLQCYWYDENILAWLSDYQNNGPLAFIAVSYGKEYRVIISDSGVECSVTKLSRSPQKLTFTGAVEAEYDGSQALEVEIPKTLWVTVTDNGNGTHSADVPHANILAAHNAGQTVCCKYGSVQFSLLSADADDCIFNNVHMYNSTSGMYYKVKISADGSVSLSLTKLEGTSGSTGGLSITDDGEGNVTVTSTGAVSITDDGEGNVTIG